MSYTIGDRVVLTEHHHPGRDCTPLLACYRDTPATIAGYALGGGDLITCAGVTVRTDDGAELHLIGERGDLLQLRRPDQPSKLDGGWPYTPMHVDLLRELMHLDASLEHSPSAAPGPYGRRNYIVLTLVEMAGELGWRAGYAWDAAAPDGYGWVAYVDMPTGQVSWHLSEEYLRVLWAGRPVDPQPRYVGRWDGHTRSDKAQRIAAYLASAEGATS